MSTFIDKIKQAIPGTTEHEELLTSQRKALEVMDWWGKGETVSSQIRSRLKRNRDFYLGERYMQFDERQTEGELRVTVNVGATVIDLMVFLLTNSSPSIQVTPATNDRSGQLEASFAEDLANEALARANFPRKFRDSAYDFLLGGFYWWYPFWNTEKKYGKKVNKFDFSKLNPNWTKVFYADDDYETIPRFITLKRLTPEKIFTDYDGFVARPDSENIFITKEMFGEGIDWDKTSVFREYDATHVTTIIDNRVARTEKHDFDFAPIFQANNRYVLNDPHGHDEVTRFLPVAQELNMLISATSEISRDLGWPAILENNGALGGKKLPKMRGNKIPLRRTDKGESLEYLINPADIGPMLRQIELLLDLFHFVALLPKAAAGIFDSSVTSGFQAKIAMQPATLNTDNKRINIDESIVNLVNSALYLIEKNDPKSLEIDENTRLVDLHSLKKRVVWPDNLPVDAAREIQNIILGLQNSLTSVTQSIDRYNVISGLGSTEETLSNLQKESGDAKLSPDRSLKVAQVSKTLADIQVALSQMSEKVAGEPDQPGIQIPENFLPGGNQTNAERALGGRSPDEARTSPDTAREAVTPESTGGTVLTP